VTNFRQHISEAGINASSLELHTYLSAVDKVAALGRAPTLGREWWHYAYSDRGTGERMRRKLYMQAGGRLQRGEHSKLVSNDPGRFRAVCMQVILERMWPNCRVCGGRGEMRLGDRVIVCLAKHCLGTGLHRYSDLERAQAIEVTREEFRLWSPIFAEVQIVLSGADSTTNAVLNAQLETG